MNSEDLVMAALAAGVDLQRLNPRSPPRRAYEDLWVEIRQHWLDTIEADEQVARFRRRADLGMSLDPTLVPSWSSICRAPSVVKAAQLVLSLLVDRRVGLWGPSAQRLRGDDGDALLAPETILAPKSSRESSAPTASLPVSSGSRPRTKRPSGGRKRELFAIEPVVERSLLTTTDEAVSRAVRAGRLAFNPAEQMSQGRVERVEVTVGRSQDLDNELRAGLKGRGDNRFVDIETSPYMAVDLRGPNFEIIALTEREQLLRPTARWEYDVLPVRSGQQKLQLCVVMRIPLPDRADEKVSVPVLERPVKVTVVPAYAVRRFAAGNWQWLVATAAGLAGVATAWIKLFHGG